MLIPNSSAMDATSSCGGPITMLPQIVTGEPEQIWAHVEQLVQKAAQFASLLAQFEQAQQQLQKAWSGGASESAIKKVGDSLQAFDKIIKAVEEGGALLGISAGMVKTAQTAYQSVVSAVNPTVAGLMSNPWTYSAAVALSTGTSATLRGFIQTVQGLLSALGAGKLAQQIATLITIISEIEQLMNSGTGATAGNTPGQQPTSPVIAPAPPNIVNPIGSTGAGVAPNGTPAPAGAAGAVSPTGAGASGGVSSTGYPTTAGSSPAAVGAGGYPAPSAAGGFPAASTAGGYPAPSAAGAYPAASTAGGFPATATGGYPAAPTPGGYPGVPTAGGFPAPGAAGGYPAPEIPAPGIASPPSITAPPSLGSGYPGAGIPAGTGDSAGWIPVDPSSHAATGDDVVVTVTDHGVATTVDVPAGHDVGLKIGSDGHVDMNVDGQPSTSAAAAHHAAATPTHAAATPTHHAAAAHHAAATHHAAAPHHAAASHAGSSSASTAHLTQQPASAITSVLAGTPATSAPARLASEDVVVTVAERDVTTTIDLPPGHEATIEIAGNHVTEHVAG